MRAWTRLRNYYENVRLFFILKGIQRELDQAVYCIVCHLPMIGPWARSHGPQPHFTCPFCGAVSYHRMDLRLGYCGRCHDFTAEPFGVGDWNEL